VYDHDPPVALSVKPLPVKVDPVQLPDRISIETGFGAPAFKPEPPAGSDAVPIAVTAVDEPVTASTEEVGGWASNPKWSSLRSETDTVVALANVNVPTARTSKEPSVSGTWIWDAVGEARNSRTALQAPLAPMVAARLLKMLPAVKLPADPSDV